MNRILLSAVVSGIGLCAVAAKRPAPRPEFHLPPVFSDHAVLQAGEVIPVWGYGPHPCYRLSCRVAGVETWTHSDMYTRNPDTKDWRIHFYLPPLKAGGPYEFVVSNLATHASKTIRDVYVGEVWLASGQSNMAFSMAETGNVLPEPRVELLRIFNGSCWTVADTNSVKRLSAVATYFGYELQKARGGAVGVLSLSCGGTRIENWMSRGALKRCPATRAWTDEFELGQCKPERWIDPPKRRPLSEAVYDPGRAPETATWGDVGCPVDGWMEVDAPSELTVAMKRTFNGAVWLRKEIEIPAAWAGQDLTLRLPAVDKQDITYFNGVEIGRTGKGLETEWFDKKRTYAVPAKLVKAGKAVIAVRAWSHVYGIGFASGSDHFSIGPAKGGAAIELEGVWLARIERDIGDRSECGAAPKRRAYVEGPSYVKPSVWFERTLEPVIPFPIRGAIWYQGESHAASIRDARAYREMLAAMVRDWRDQWGLGDFPFGIVQISNFAYLRRHVPECGWAEVQFSQLQASRDIPNCGIISAIDLGEEFSVHPRNKRDVARRLVRWARSEVYGEKSDAPYTGPRFLSGAVEGSRVRIRFTEAQGGIEATAPVTGAVIRGADGAWHSATVAIDGETLLVSSPAVSAPVEVRYGWAMNPLGATLRGKANKIPVFPFRWTAK